MTATFTSGGLVQSPNEVQQLIFAILILFYLVGDGSALPKYFERQ